MLPVPFISLNLPSMQTFSIGRACIPLEGLSVWPWTRKHWQLTTAAVKRTDVYMDCGKKSRPVVGTNKQLPVSQDTVTTAHRLQWLLTALQADCSFLFQLRKAWGTLCSSSMLEHRPSQKPWVASCSISPLWEWWHWKISVFNFHFECLPSTAVLWNTETWAHCKR